MKTSLIMKDLGIMDTGSIRTDTGKPRRRRMLLIQCSQCNKQYQITKVSYDVKKNDMCQSCSVAKSATKHGMSSTRLYKLWNKIKDRCYNTKQDGYEMYGGRGITMSSEFLDFNIFSSWSLNNGYTDELTIDRIDNDIGYSADNCRWVGWDIQSTNKPKRKDNTSGYTGIRKEKNLYRATINSNGSVVYDKRFDTIEKAVHSRNKFIADHHYPHKIQRIKNGIS